MNGKPIKIRAAAVNMTSEVGADDVLVAVRVVPDGRDGNTVFARTLRPDEADGGDPVVVQPHLGERLRFRRGSIKISMADVDRSAPRSPDGYAPITNTIWTWLSIASPTDPTLFRYLLAVARRLDGAHVILTEGVRTLSDLDGGFIRIRQQIYRALALAEILVIALGRSIDMLDGLQQQFSIALPLPEAIRAERKTIREMRNAFEHIDDRALGCVRGAAHPDALSVFSQHDFLDRGVLAYGPYRLDVRQQVPDLLVQGRTYVYDIAATIAGPMKEIKEHIEFFTPSDE